MTSIEEELQNNPLLVNEGLPPFDQIKPEHILSAVRHLLTESAKKIDHIEQTIEPTWSSVIERLEELDRPFEYCWRPIAHLFGVKNSPELREAYEQALPEVVQFGLRVNQSKPIYDALKSIRGGQNWEQLNSAQQRIIDKRILSAELSGIGLDGETRDRFNQITQELSQLGTSFSNHVLDATKAYALELTLRDEIEGLPPSLLQIAAQAFNTAHSDDVNEMSQATAEDGPWRITLETSSFVPFMEHSQRRDLREQLYRAFITRAAEGELDNGPLIDETLQKRREKAQLLGFQNFAEISLADKMADNVAAVEKMFATLRSASWEAAQTDMQALQELAAESGCDEPLMNWDIAFWAARLREKRFDFTDEQIRPYFPLERVLDGLFALVEKLFGVSVVAASDDIPIWNEDVRFFNVFDESRNHIASFYLDPFSRPEDKRGGAWMDECLSRRRVGDQIQLPVAHLVCNSTPPVGDRPSLMTFREVETLFHEFGHGLQHMLTTVDEADAAGINGVEWDAVELPSQFMENWCYHKPTLQGISGHYETQEPLPSDLFEKLRAARTFRSGSQMLRQLLFGMTDMSLHSGYDPDSSESVFDVQRRISETTAVLPMLPEDRSLCAFQHIFAGGYAAGYYSYKWAEVLSADAFSAFEEVGLDQDDAIKQAGRRFRDTILSQGGSQHPMELFKNFRGREPNPEALLRHSGLSSGQ